MAARKVDNRDVTFFLRLLSQSARDTSSISDEAQDTAVIEAINRLHDICEGQIDMVGTVNTPISKLFHRCTASVTQYRSSTGLLMLAILQFFLDFGDYVLHDADPSLNIFFKSCLSRLYADPKVAAATLDFLNRNIKKLLLSHSSLLPQYFPLLLKVIAWNGDVLDEPFLQLFPALMGPSSFLPLFPALLDLPTLVLALENLERRSGSLLSDNVAMIQKSPAPEALLALMDEAYTGSSTADQGGDSSGDENTTSKDEAEALFSDLLRDENDGLAERHWTFPGMAAALEAVMGSTKSERLKHAIKFVPLLLQVYFGVAIRDVNDSLLCALLPILFQRIDAMFPDKGFCLETQKRSLEFMLAAFQWSPDLISILKKPIIDKIGQPFTSATKAELALQLCWAVGEHGGGGPAFKDAARELFECLELLLYENLSVRGVTARPDPSRSSAGVDMYAMSSQARLLCVVVTAIAKLATFHRELGPRAHVCLAKVARSHQILDKVVWTRARDQLGLMHEPAIGASILGPAAGCNGYPGNVCWSDGQTKAVSHLPFYLLQEKEGPPFHDFSLSDVLGQA